MSTTALLILEGLTGPEYQAWLTMRKFAKANGVEICDDWQAFPAFYADMGARPSDTHCLRRKSADLPFHKENCHWRARADRTGQRFGSLVVVGRDRDIGWRCQCDCGRILKLNVTHLHARGEGDGACRCAAYAARRPRFEQHGGTVGPDRNEYSVWRSMLARCFNPNSPRYELWGGRGITVCDRWRASFRAFREDVGPRPTLQHTLDRFPNQNGNYEPGNVRWATALEQARNKRNNRVLTLDGDAAPVAAWAERVGVNARVIYNRLRLGWSTARALTAPVRSRKPTPRRTGELNAGAI